MLKLYVTMETKTSNRQWKYPKNFIYKAVFLLSVKVHFKDSYKFKIIHIGYTNAENREIFGSKFTLPWQPKFQ